MGHSVNRQEIKQILEPLEFTVQDQGQKLRIGVPSFRATKDISGMSAEERKTFFSRVSVVMERSELTRLLPGTLATLIEGVSVVAEMDRGIQALVDAKPQILADVPAEAKKAHEAQTKAIRDSHEVLREVKKALDAIGY